MRVQAGYILTLSLIMVATLMIVVTSVVNQVRVSRHLTRLSLERAQAQYLALSAVQLVYAQLMPDESQGASATKQSQSVLKEFVTYSSWWQEYDLTEEQEGVTATLGLYLVPEEGKININALYDFKEKKFIKNQRFDARSFLGIIEEKLRPFIKGSFIDGLEKLFRDKGKPLDDITELKAIPELALLAPEFFAHPLTKEETFVPALSDIFTVMPVPRIYPATLSLSLQWVFGLQDPHTATKQGRLELAGKVKEISNVQTEWDAFYSSIYKKKFTELQGEFKLLLDTKFEGRFFSIISYGKVGTITERLCVLIERLINQDKSVTYTVRKLYWI